MIKKQGIKKESKVLKKEARNDIPLVNDSWGGNTLFKVGLWSGAGYMLDEYLAWAHDESDAIDAVADWCANNAEGDVVSLDEYNEAFMDAVTDSLRDSLTGEYKPRLNTGELESTLPEALINDIASDELSLSEIAGAIQKVNSPAKEEAMSNLREEWEGIQDEYYMTSSGTVVRAENLRVEEVDPEEMGLTDDEDEDEDDFDEALVRRVEALERKVRLEAVKKVRVNKSMKRNI